MRANLQADPNFDVMHNPSITFSGHSTSTVAKSCAGDGRRAVAFFKGEIMGYVANKFKKRDAMELSIGIIIGI